jgi:hypothetical protein
VTEPAGPACDNCGFPDADLVRVRRVYVVPASWENEGSETVVPEPEMWCVSCCSQYPNEGAEPEA